MVRRRQRRSSAPRLKPFPTLLLLAIVCGLIFLHCFSQIAVLEDSLLALWAQVNGNTLPPPSLLKGQLTASDAGAGGKRSPSKQAVSGTKHKDFATLSALKGELDSRLRSFLNNMAPSPEAVPLAVDLGSRSNDASVPGTSHHRSAQRTSSNSPISRPRSRALGALPPLTSNVRTAGGTAEEFDPQAELEAASR